MSEEEKKALYNLKDMFEDIEIKEITKDVKLTMYGKAILDILIAINLIENQQKELDSLKEIEKSHQEENGKLRVKLEQEKSKTPETIRKQFEVYQNKIQALEKQHEYDMQMIDEVKGNAVKWANELEQEKNKINYEIDNCATDLDTLITLDKRAIRDLENNTHEIEQHEVLTIIREFIRLRNDYEQEKEKNKLLQSQLNGAFDRGFISKDKIKAIQGQLCMQLGSYVRNEASPEQERIAGGINIINKILEEK